MHERQLQEAIRRWDDRLPEDWGHAPQEGRPDPWHLDAWAEAEAEARARCPGLLVQAREQLYQDRRR